jgi:hypothetical protein
MSGMASGSADPLGKKPKSAAITDPAFEILSSISKLKPANDHQAGIRDVLESVAAMCVHDDLLVNTLAELLPPETLVVSQVLTHPTMFHVLRQMLIAGNVAVRTGRGHPIVSAVMEALYMDPDERAEGIRRYSEYKRGYSAGQIFSAETSSQTSVRNENSHGGDSFRAEKRAHNIATRWQDRDKFSGSIGAVPSLDDIRNKYIDACEDYSLPPAERLSFIHHILKDESYRFFQSQIKGKASSYGEAFDMLRKEFCNPARQHQTKAMLDGMRISTLMSEGMTRVKALAEAYQLVGRLNSQCPPAFVGDAHKVSMLARTVQDEPWAANVLEDNMVQPMSYHDFHSRLSAALTLRDETLTRASNTHSLLYGSQYATPRHKARRNNYQPNVQRQPSKSPVDKSKRRCWRCDVLGHYADECTSPRRLTMTDAVRARIASQGNSDKAAAQVLFQFSRQVDLREQERVEEFEDIQKETINTFDALLLDDADLELEDMEQIQDFTQPDEN